MSDDLITENRRLYVLKCLKTSGDYRMSDALLYDLLKRIGIGVSLSVVRGDLAWLEQQSLLSTQKLGDLTIALLRCEGVDVAEGISSVPGIARPKPAS
jgi:Fe2+ or Zn2+ uptake regulation protein